MIENFYLKAYDKYYTLGKNDLCINQVEKLLTNFCHLQDLINKNIEDLAFSLGSVLKILHNKNHSEKIIKVKKSLEIEEIKIEKNLNQKFAEKKKNFYIKKMDIKNLEEFPIESLDDKNELKHFDINFMSKMKKLENSNQSNYKKENKNLSEFFKNDLNTKLSIEERQYCNDNKNNLKKTNSNSSFLEEDILKDFDYFSNTDSLIFFKKS